MATMRMPPTLLTRSLLSSFQTHPNLPPHSWYWLAGTTLSALNRPDEVARVLQFALKPGTRDSTVETPSCQEPQLMIARKMREAMVKSAAIAGLPKTINSLLALKNVTPPSLLDEALLNPPTMRSVEVVDVPVSRMLMKGQRFFDNIYGKISRRVMGQMERSGAGDDLAIVAKLSYGYILSETSILSPGETSACLVAGLIPQDVNPQLKGHLKGACRDVDGLQVEQVRAVRALVLKVCGIYGMRPLGENDVGGWGWRTAVADV